MTEPDPSPARPLRSVHAPGSVRWATRRAQWRALGLTDADLEKPKIAVVNSSSDMAICFSHLDEIAARVKAGVRAAGGSPSRRARSRRATSCTPPGTAAATCSLPAT